MSIIIRGFKPSGGKHCITNALKQVFQYNEYPISEEMIFGIGSGLSFLYINLASSPMISGRIKTFEFESKLSKRLNVKIQCKSTKRYDKAFEKTKFLIREGQPVLVYVDMPYLQYLNLDEDNHFGGHAIIIFGFDDEKQKFYVSDRDNSDYSIRTPKGLISEDFHLVDYQQIEKARSSNYRPFPANNKWIEFDFKSTQPVTAEIIIEAVKETCDTMLNPPAKLLGVNGINKFSNEVLKWNKFESHKVKLAGITNYFMISADGGTGGGAFRYMYGKFLLEAYENFGISDYKYAGEQYTLLSEKWNEIAELLWKLYETGEDDILKTISLIAKDICSAETSILNYLSKVKI